MKTEAVDMARVADAIEALRREVARLSERVTALEKAAAPAGDASAQPAPTDAAAAAADGLSEELILVIGAAVAAFLGKKAHIRQIRLLGSAGWAQQGRLTIQASHALKG
jgi:methylmalonyl-CoA carboxyltransferase large subunit